MALAAAAGAGIACGLTSVVRGALRLAVVRFDGGVCAVALLLVGIDWVAVRKETLSDLSLRSGSLIP